jgi:hypothetical protein
MLPGRVPTRICVGASLGEVAARRSVGDSYDNAMVEAFWSRMQVELLDRRRWKTRGQAG